MRNIREKSFYPRTKKKIFARYGWRDSLKAKYHPHGGPSNKVQSVPRLQINEHENFTSLYIRLGVVSSREAFKSA